MSLGLWIIINILVLLGMFLYLNRKINRKLEIHHLVARARKELEGVLVELNHATERNVALMEDRIQQVKKTLEAIDKRLAVLNREMGKKLPPTYHSVLQKQEMPLERVGLREEKRKEFTKAEVLDLYNKGISPALIAAKLGTTIGEVELIISLQDRKERELYNHENTKQG
ncbi:MAG: hypothetical protein N2442_00860 [Spirochaetes bacterium]|nr:hypothetical protein [Spirochaetota bacterium]